MKRLWMAGVLVLLAACGGGAAKRPAEEPHRPYTFQPAVPPAHLTAAAKAEWMRWHYWDGFDFADTARLAEQDTSQLVEAYARYVMLLASQPTDGAPMDSLMRRASQSRPMLDYFAWLGQVVLHDPNSPLRSDEFYIPVLKAQLASPYYDEYERIGPTYELQIASQNRIGQPANDFRYTLAPGITGRLYGLQADYVLLFISNPGCPMCREVCEAIQASPMLTELIERGALQVLVFYPDEDLTEWRNHRSEIPDEWIYAYDDGCVVSEQSLYNLSAIPALYLLDGQKRVLVKDSVDVAAIEEAIDRAQ